MAAVRASLHQPICRRIEQWQRTLEELARALGLVPDEDDL